MITVLLVDNKEQVKEMLADILSKSGNFRLALTRNGDTLKVISEEDLGELISLKEKIGSLEESLYAEKKGVLYKAVLEAIEKPLIECVLERTEGNQFRAARVLGINRNTIRAKIKRLGIDAKKWRAEYGR